MRRPPRRPRPDRARRASCTDSPGWTSSPGCGTSRTRRRRPTCGTSGPTTTPGRPIPVPSSARCSTRWPAEPCPLTAQSAGCVGALSTTRARSRGRNTSSSWRSGAQDSSAELLLDENDLAEGSDYFSLGLREPSPDGSAAGLLGRPGRRRGLRAAVPGPADRQGPGRHGRPHLLRRRLVGRLAAPSSTWCTTRPTGRTRCGGTSSAPTPPTDVLVLQEDDERFELDVRGEPVGGVRRRDPSLAKDSTEVWLVPTDRPGRAAPRGPAAHPRGPLLRSRTRRGPDGDELLVVTNDGATEFRLAPRPGRHPGPRALGRTWSARTRRSAC